MTSIVKSGKTKGARHKKKIIIRGVGGKKEKIQINSGNKTKQRTKAEENETHADQNMAPVEP